MGNVKLRLSGPMEGRFGSRPPLVVSGCCHQSDGLQGWASPMLTAGHLKHLKHRLMVGAHQALRLLDGFGEGVALGLSVKNCDPVKESTGFHSHTADRAPRQSLFAPEEAAQGARQSLQGRAQMRSGQTE